MRALDDRPAPRGALKPAVLALAGLLALAPVARAEDFATVLKVAGPVEFRHDHAWKPAMVGTELFQGDAIRTGDKGFATVRDVRGAITDLYPLTTLSITQDSQLSVEAGRIWSHFLHVIGVPRQIRTPDAVAMIRGTTLSVAVEGHNDSVTVLEGHVEVRTVQGLTTMVNGGFAVDVDHGMLGTVLPANPALLEQGQRFLRHALPLLQPEQGAAPPPKPKARPQRQSPQQGRLPDAEQRAHAEWDAHGFGLGARPVGPHGRDESPGAPEAPSRLQEPQRQSPEGLSMEGPGSLGVLAQPGAVPPIVGEGDVTRNLSVEKMERPSGVVNPQGVLLPGFGTSSGGTATGRSTDGGAGTGGGITVGGPGPMPYPSTLAPPMTTSQSIVTPIKGQAEHVNSLAPASSTKGTGASGTN